MAEYGSGMFYGKATSRFLNSSQLLSSSISQVLSLPPALDIGPPIISSKVDSLNKPYSSASSLPVKYKDVVILSEFSEIEGPIPLVAIPQQIPEDFDLNELVLQLMCTDYQNMGSSDFKITKDTSLLIQDYEKNHHIYVHYFTLYDVRARGFVRPMCLAFITREAQKIRKFYKELKSEFCQVTEYLKVSNLQIFLCEIKARIEDLHYTKRRYICAHDHFPRDDESEITQEYLSDKSKLKKVLQEACGVDDTAELLTIEDSLKTSVQCLSPSKMHSTSPNMIHLSPSKMHSTSPNVIHLSPSKRHSSSPAEHSTPLFFNRSELKPESLKSLSPVGLQTKNDSVKGYLKEGVLESSSDSSTSTIKSVKVSSLMLDDSLDQKMNQEDELSILQHTSLEALAAQLLDCQYISEVVQKYLKHSPVVQELDNFLNEVRSNAQSPVYKALEELGLLGELSDFLKDPKCSPSVFVIALMRRNFRNMRQIRNLCGIGYAASLIKLFLAYGNLSKPSLTLHFERLDREIYDNPMSSLFVGHIPVINLGVESQLRLREDKIFSLGDSCWDKDIARLLCVDLSKISTPESEFVDARESLDQLPSDVTVGDDCLEVFVQSPKKRHHSSPSDDGSIGYEAGSSSAVPIKIRHPSTPIRSTSSDDSWLSYKDSESEGEEGVEEEAALELPNETDNKVLRLDIQERMEKGNTYHMSALIQQFSGVSQSIINSILSGKPMIIAGPQCLKNVVVLYTKALSTILPYTPNKIQPVLKWHTGTITLHHITQFRIIGVCIPERLHVQDLMSIATLNKVTVLNIETGHISGVAYSGSLLHKGDQLSRRRFKANQTLQAALQSIIISLGMKCFLLFHLLKTTSRSSSEILKGISVPRGDWDIIRFLTQMMQNQIDGRTETDSHPFF